MKIKKKRILYFSLSLTALILNMLLFPSIFSSPSPSENKNIEKSPSISSTAKLEWFKRWGWNEKCSYNKELVLDNLGNIYLIGYTGNYMNYHTEEWGRYDIYFSKCNSSGALLWDKTWRGSGLVNRGEGIVIDDLGNVYITGFTQNYSSELYYINDPNVLLLKYDSSGNLLWNRTWGGAGTDRGYGIALDNSGNIYITGRCGGDMLILKYDSSGNLLWKRTWGGAGTDIGYGITLDNSGKIYITGSCGGDMLILKYNSSGNIYITGSCGGDILILKYNSSGNRQWYRTFHHSGVDIGYDIVLDSFGSVFIAGKTGDYYLDPAGGITSGDDDVLLLKYDSSGNLLWDTTWNLSTQDRGYGIALDSFGSIYIAGESGLDTLLLKFKEYEDENSLGSTMLGYNLLVLFSIIFFISLYIFKKIRIQIQ